MADISTPGTARKTEEFTASQRQLVRDSLFIHDFPYQPDKTYIVFDADSGNNDLHIITGASNTYTITQGDGTQPVEYSDTGGTKTLNYASAGRYLITISGTFNGINVSGASAGGRNKYIGIIGGSNYPVSIIANAFASCSLLEFAYFKYATSVGNSFTSCTSLMYIDFSIATSVGSFTSCTSLVSANFPSATTIGSFTSCTSLVSINAISATSIGLFTSCTALVSVNFPSVTSISDDTFKDCTALVSVNFPSVTSIGIDAFRNCTSLISVDFPLAVGTGNSAFNSCTSLINASFPVATGMGQDAFNNCASLRTVNFASTTYVNAQSFKDCVSLRYVEVNYDAAFLVSTNAFLNVSLSDLHVIGAGNLTNAQAIETLILAQGMTKLTGYRLLY